MTDTSTSTGPVYKIGQLALVDWRDADGTEHHSQRAVRGDAVTWRLLSTGSHVFDHWLTAEPVLMKPVPADALVLPERPVGLSGGWAEYDWRGFARDESERLRLVAACLSIAEALEAVGIGRPGDNGEWPEPESAATPTSTGEPTTKSTGRWSDGSGPVESPAGGEPIELARYRAAIEVQAAAVVESMCHWAQGCGDARSESHERFHYGSPCPYEAMAAVLRGEPDPREPAPGHVHDSDTAYDGTCKNCLPAEPDQSVAVTAREVLGLVADCAGRASNMAGSGEVGRQEQAAGELARYRAVIEQHREVARLARLVMDTLQQYGPSIVGHLLDTDENDGQCLRQALAALGDGEQG